MDLIIAMSMAYLPFVWYWIGAAKRDITVTDKDIHQKRRRKNNQTYWGEQ